MKFVGSILLYLLPLVVWGEEIKNIVVTPSSEQKVVESIIPFTVGDEFSQDLLDVSKKSLTATNRFEVLGVNWDSESGTLRFRVNPKTYIEDIEWRGTNIRGEGGIEDECLPQQLESVLSQELRSEISRCILEVLTGRGYLDAQVFLSVDETVLQIEVDRGERYRVESVSISGASEDRRDLLVERLNNKPDAFFAPSEIEKDIETITDYYFSQEYYLVKVFQPNVQVAPDSKVAHLRFRVREGKEFEIEFTGDVTSEAVLEDVLEREGDVPEWFIEEVVDLQRERLLAEGFIDVEVEARIEERDEETYVEIQTKKGDRFRLTEPDWIGLSDPEAITSLYRKISDQTAGTFFNEAKFKESFEDEFLEEIYKRGYLDIALKGIEFAISTEEAEVTPIIYMNEGPRHEIVDRAILGMPGGFNDLQELSDLRAATDPGDIYRVERIEELSETLNQALIAVGFLDSEVSVSPISTDGRVDLSIVVTSGPRYRISKIIIRGAYKTDYDVLKNEVEIEEGEFYSQEDIDDSISAVLRLGVARSVDINVFDQNPDTGEAILLVEVFEAARFRFEFGPGFGTIDGVRATFRGTWANIGGRARRISVFAKASREIESAKVPPSSEVKDPQKTPFIERTITVEYFEPSLLRTPLDGRLTYTHAKKSENKFDQLENSFSGILDFRFSRHWLFSSFYRLEFSKTFNVAIEDNPFQVEAGFNRFTSIGQSITGQYLDDDFNPSQGWKGFYEVELFEKLLGGDSNLWKMSTKQDFFYPIYTIRKDRQIKFAFSIFSGISDAYPDRFKVPVEKRFFVGGESSVRGYGEQSINPENFTGGQSAFVFRSELSIPVFWDVSLLGFFDGGNAYASNVDFNPFDLRYGAGAGIRLDTIVGPLKVGYGFIIDRQIDNNGNKEPLGNLYIGVGPL